MEIYAIYNYDEFVGFKSNFKDACEFILAKIGKNDELYSEIKDIIKCYEECGICDDYWSSSWEIVVIKELE